MTAALTVYSAVFMRYALAVTPQNYLLFGCHLVNCSAQAAQGYRYLSYHNWGGKEKTLEEKARQGVQVAENKGKELAAKAEQKIEAAVGK